MTAAMLQKAPTYVSLKKLYTRRRNAILFARMMMMIMMTSLSRRTQKNLVEKTYALYLGPT